MQKKTNVFGAVLLCCALVLAFTACAGCTGDDTSTATNNANPIVGTYVTSLVGSGMILDFHADFTVDLIATALDGTVTKDTKKYTGNGNNEYSADDIVIQVSDDANVLAVTGLNQSGVLTFNKFSNYKIPTVSPTQTPTPTPTPTQAINSASVGNYIRDDSQSARVSWTINECIRGEKANQLIAEASDNNKVPDSGYEYLLCNYKVRCFDDDPIRLNGTIPFTVLADGEKAERPIVSLSNEYDPFGASTSQYFSHEGWIAYIVPVSSQVRIYLGNNESSLENRPYIYL